jgi:hypothetical protein
MGEVVGTPPGRWQQVLANALADNPAVGVAAVIEIGPVKHSRSKFTLPLKNIRCRDRPHRRSTPPPSSLTRKAAVGQSTMQVNDQRNHGPRMSGAGTS